MVCLSHLYLYPPLKWGQLGATCSFFIPPGAIARVCRTRVSFILNEFSALSAPKHGGTCLFLNMCSNTCTMWKKENIVTGKMSQVITSLTMFTYLIFITRSLLSLSSKLDQILVIACMSRFCSNRDPPVQEWSGRKIKANSMIYCFCIQVSASSFAQVFLNGQ